MTALRPTSLPVPAVVGTATQYGSGRSTGRASGRPSSYSNRWPGWTAISATALATSRAAPPPMPTIASARCARNASTPALTCEATGLPATPENGAASSGESDASTSAKTGSAARPRSVTTSGRLRPCACRSSPMRRRAPGPKWIRVGKLKV